MSEHRPDLPPMPAAIAALPVHRGYPVPWFVAWLDAARLVPVGQGEPDFRILRPDAPRRAVAERRCWICGGVFALGEPQVFAIGPMCAVNRTSSEPPSHPLCALWSAQACPFLTRPHMERRDAGMPAEVDDSPGIMLRRNPGVTLLWASRGPRGGAYGGPGGWFVYDVPGGGLFDIGDPLDVRWYARGREATRDEILASIESGLPALREVAELQPGGVEHLKASVTEAMTLVPA